MPLVRHSRLAQEKNLGPTHPIPLEVVCPNETHLSSRTVFLGGGMSTSVNWQEQLAQMLAGCGLTFFNPRRRQFAAGTARKRADIEWEHRYLCQAQAIVFWFPEETLCPISLYELGSWSMTSKTLFVGVHPNYARRIDVEVQTDIARPDVKLVYDLSDLAEQVRTWGMTQRLPQQLLKSEQRGKVVAPVYAPWMQRAPI